MKSCCHHPRRSDFYLKPHSSCGESAFGLVNKSQGGLRIGGTGSLFQKDSCQFSVSKQLHYWFLSLNRPQREHTKGECIVSQEAAGCTPNRPHRNLTKRGDWAGKETFKRSAHRQPTDCTVLSLTEWPGCPNPKEAKFQNNIKFKNGFVRQLFKISPALTQSTMTWHF